MMHAAGSSTGSSSAYVACEDVAMSTTADPRSDARDEGDLSIVADALFAAIEAGDTDALVGLYHSDAKIWHNFDQVEQSVEENMKVLRFLVRSLSDRRYEEVRRVMLDDGFVQQHVLRGTTPRGAFEMPAMMRVWIDGGKVSRIEEYLDPAPAKILRS